MKRTLLVVLLLSMPLLAQHRGGGMGRAAFAHRGGGNFAFARAAVQPFYAGTYYAPPAFYNPPPYNPQPPWGWWVNGPPPVVWPAAPVQETIIYIPTYMRPDNGPSLGEIARQVGVGKHKHPLGANTFDMQN